MWDRTILKQNAKLALAGRKYRTAFLVCLIDSLILGIFNIAGHFSSPAVNIFSADAVQQYERTFSGRTSFWQVLMFIFVGLPLSVGVARFFVRNRFGRTELETMFSSFTDNYGRTVGGMFTTVGVVFLWSLLFIIPGIVKWMEYSMVRFILSDNPALSGTRAREISRRMTQGEKGAVFVLYLSFLGWYFLAGIVLTMFEWWLWPVSGVISCATTALIAAYQEATFAELYIFMRDRAIRTGAVTAEELGLAY